MASALRTILPCKCKKYSELCSKLVFDSVTLFIRHCTDAQFNAPQYLFFRGKFLNENEKCKLIANIRVFEDFVSEKEEKSFMEELEPQLKRMRYESNHWDGAIKGYRETEKIKWNPINSSVLEKVRALAFESHDVPLKHVHILDLEENGVIMPHIDSIKFCGTKIAGISLLSDSVMRLIHKEEKNKILDVLLKRRSLYIISGITRYCYTHEILGNENSMFGDKIVKKQRRISIICRNEP